MIMGLLAALALAVSAQATTAKIRPYDQQTAKSLTLKLDDFDTGWKISERASTGLERNSCTSAPKIQRATTGYSRSADFTATDTGDDVMSTTRVFATPTLAEKWYRWAAGPKAAACMLNYEVASRQQSGYRVTGISRSRVSFRAYPDCGQYSAGWSLRCYMKDHLAAWRMKYTIAGHNDKYTIVYDYVVARSGSPVSAEGRIDDWRAIVGFYFWGVESPVWDEEGFVESVLERTV
jgi:hypothetical protein